MNSKEQFKGEVDEQGRLCLPPDIAARFGLVPGATVEVEAGENELHLLRPVNHLAKLYIEPTNICNLNCVTCMRNVWEEPSGLMTEATFERVLAGMQEFSPLPKVFFGGFGEPLAHPEIIEMIRRVKGLGATVELITNGILLNEKRASALIEMELDGLWISLDGATSQSYEDVRLGAELPRVIDNLRRMRAIRYRTILGRNTTTPVLGIAFVAMQWNIAELPQVLRLGASLGAKRFSISNVIAHTTELQDEVLYRHTMEGVSGYRSSNWPVVNLPRIDVDTLTQVPLFEIYRRKYVLQLAGKESNRAVDACPFVEQGSAAVRWDGQISPCLPLLHTHTSFLGKKPRRTTAYILGSLHDRKLRDLWEDSDYLAFRKRVRQFNFSPARAAPAASWLKRMTKTAWTAPSPPVGAACGRRGSSVSMSLYKKNPPDTGGRTAVQ